MKKNNITILGAGSFGTAMAKHLAETGEARHEPALWCRRAEQAREIETTRENARYLKGLRLPGNVALFGGDEQFAECLERADMIVLAVPAQSTASVLARIATHGAQGKMLVNLSKGIEIESGLLMHQLAAKILPGVSYTALSGPSHAEEVAKGMPTALVAASTDEAAAYAWQEAMNDERLRIYTSRDVLGVEIGGAMKNVIAIAVGVVRAVGFGDNAVAALATRGLAEIMRYGAFLGANPLTLAGLAGIGDLMATCYSNLSRNLRFGLAVGGGKSGDEAAAEIGQVVEGMFTARALVTRARAEGVELPLADAVYQVLYENRSLRDVVKNLLFREPKAEIR